MPTSRSRKSGAESPGAGSAGVARWPAWALGALVALAILLIALPASLFGALLPPGAVARDFSGSVWHGSVGRLSVNGREAGALEWRVHPAALLRLTLSADLHWVQGAFEARGTAALDRQALSLGQVTGGGPLESLQSLGIPPGWHGTASLHIDHLRAVFAARGPQLQSADGQIQVDRLSGATFAGGADLGGFTLSLPAGAIDADGKGSANLTDIGGPVALQAQIQFSLPERRGIASGTVAARPDASQSLRAEIDQLARFRPRDPRGRVPFDLELSL